MQDRVPLYPGRVMLTPVPGEENTFDMVRADSPTQEGTPLNKASLLKDATAKRFGLDDSAVPDDVLNKICTKMHEYGEIGDVMITTRKYLGDQWLLCNGESISSSEYPELAEFIRGVSGQTIGSAVNLLKIAHYNGTWVAVGYDSSGSSDYPYIFATTDPTGTWTGAKISTTSAVIRDIYCHNGTWVAVGADNSNQYPYIWTTTDPFGSWTQNRISTSYVRLCGIYCHNGTWVAVGYRNSSNYPYIYIATDPTGTWIEKSIGSPECQLDSVTYQNGTWVASGSYSGNVYIYTATDPTGTWTSKALSLSVSFTSSKMICHNGIFVIAGRSGDYPRILTTSDLTGKWVEKQLSTGKIHLNDIAAYNGSYVAVGSSIGINTPYYFTADDPSGDWVEHSLPGTVLLYGVSYEEGTWVAVGYDGSENPYIFCDSYYLLPAISPDKAYAYIKALEG